MAGFGHKSLAMLGRGLRPYLNPDAVEKPKSKSSRYTKPAWQRENEQRAAMLATEAKRRGAQDRITKSDLLRARQAKDANLQSMVDAGSAPQTDEGTLKGLRALHSNATGRLNPDIARVGMGTQHADMPLSAQDRQASQIAYQNIMNEKPAKILTDALSGSMAADYEADKRALAKEVMAFEKAEMQKQGTADQNRIRLKKAADAQAKRDLAAETLEENKMLKSLAAERKEQRTIEVAQRKFSQQQVDRIKKEKAALAKIQLAADKAAETAQIKADKAAAAAQLASEQRVQKALDKLNKRGGGQWRTLTNPVREQLRDQVFGEGGSLRSGFEAHNVRVDPNAPTTRSAPLQWPESADTVTGFLGSQLRDFGIGADPIPIPMGERETMSGPVSDTEWDRMVSPQERSVIMDRLWRAAVDQANAKGTDAQDEFSMLNLLISEGKLSPYDFSDGANPDITVQDEGVLLAKLQSGDPLGNNIYNIAGAGQFQWDQSTQKFVQVQ